MQNNLYGFKKRRKIAVLGDIWVQGYLWFWSGSKKMVRLKNHFYK